MPPSAASAAKQSAQRGRPSKPVGFDASALLADLLGMAPDVREEFIRALPSRDRGVLFDTAHYELGTPYGLWRDDPVGFAKGPAQQTLWSKQVEILASVGRNKKTAVPSTVGVGKTRISAVATTWWGAVWPPGTAKVVTTATRFRQVKTQIWPEIRTVHAHAGLPGRCDTTQWKLLTADGVEWVTAYGFSAPDWDETAAQGIHAGRLLVIVDEAGGFGHIIGTAFESITTAEHDRALFIGNPPTDVEGSWFEGLCSQSETVTIPIPIFETPNYTGETVGVCQSCPPGMPEHDARTHLTETDWEPRIRRDYGEDSPYYQARVLARFPRGGPSRALPGDWLDAAVEMAREGTPDRPQVVGDRDGNPFPYQPKAGAWIRLGVDVASGGGDELAVARCEGDVIRVVHHESGKELQNPHYAAGKVLEQIRIAEALRRRLGTAARIRVKVDATGVGIGVAGILEAWETEGIHEAQIVRVYVGEAPEEGRREAHETMRPKLKKDEMYLGFRHLLQPDERTGDPAVALDIDTQTRAQLGAAKMGWDSGGLTVIEPKDKIKERLGRSPDRGEACMLSTFEPYTVTRKYRRTIITGA
jgi:hypothetical protein